MFKTRLPLVARHPLNPIAVLPSHEAFGLVPCVSSAAARLPVEVITQIVSELWQISKHDTLPFNVTQLCQLAVLEREPALWTVILESWNTLAFAKTLDSIRWTASRWNDSISEHPWWQDNILNLVTRLQATTARPQPQAQGGSRRIARPSTSDHDHAVTLLDKAHQYCFLCVLEWSYAGKSILPVNDWGWTCLMGKIPRCRATHGEPMCSYCLRSDDWSEVSEEASCDSLELQWVRDYNTWGLGLATVCDVCMSAKMETAASALGMVPNHGGLREISSWWRTQLMSFPLLKAYREDGDGTLNLALKMFAHKDWLDRVAELPKMAEIALTDKRTNAQKEIAAKFSMLDKRFKAVSREVDKRKFRDSMETLKQRYAAVERTVVLDEGDWETIMRAASAWVADIKVQKGFWYSPHEEIAIMKGAPADGYMNSLDTGLTPLDQHKVIMPKNNLDEVVRTILLSPSVGKLAYPSESTADFAAKVWANAMAEPIRPVLRNIMDMIIRISFGPDHNVPRAKAIETAFAKASEIKAEDLLEWVRDPRMHYDKWWKNGYHEAPRSPAVQVKRKREEDQVVETPVAVSQETEMEDEIPEVPEVPESPPMQSEMPADGPEVVQADAVSSGQLGNLAGDAGANKRRRISGKEDDKDREVTMNFQQPDPQPNRHAPQPSGTGTLSPDSIQSSSSGVFSGLVSNADSMDTAPTSVSANSDATANTEQAEYATVRMASIRAQIDWPVPRVYLSSQDCARLQTRKLKPARPALYAVPAPVVGLSPALKNLMENIWKRMIKADLGCACKMCIRAYEQAESFKKQQEIANNTDTLYKLAANMKRSMQNEPQAISHPVAASAMVLPANYSQIVMSEEGSEAGFEEYEEEAEMQVFETPADETLDELELSSESTVGSELEDDEMTESGDPMEQPPAGDE